MVSCKVSALLTSLMQTLQNYLFQEASAFFKKRAVIEDEYGRTLQKLSRSTSEVYAVNDGKAGFV
jgi:hypothetical protein